MCALYIFIIHQYTVCIELDKAVIDTNLCIELDITDVCIELDITDVCIEPDITDVCIELEITVYRSGDY